MMDIQSDMMPDLDEEKRLAIKIEREFYMVEKLLVAMQNHIRELKDSPSEEREEISRELSALDNEFVTLRNWSRDLKKDFKRFRALEGIASVGNTLH
jgi:hypothetical protein